MAKSYILLLFLLFTPMESGLNHLTSEKVFPFKLGYADICDPKTITQAQMYNVHYLFQQFFLTLNDKYELDIQKSITPFELHKQAVTKYLEDLNKASQYLNNEAMDINYKLYYRKKLHFVGQAISKEMYFGPDKTLPVFKNEIQLERQWNLSGDFLNFYQQKFGMITDLTFFFEEAKNYAESEMTVRNQFYFKPELCGVKQLLYQLVNYFTGPTLNPTNNYLFQGDAIPLEQKDRLLRFFNTYYSLNTDKLNCFNEGNDRKSLFMKVMKLIFTDIELNTLLYDNPDQQNFGPSKIAETYDPEEDSDPGHIVRRDIYLLEFPKRIDDLDLVELGGIRGKKIHFSLYFLRFLDKDVPKEIKDLQDQDKLPKNLNPNEYPDILYTIYVDLRSAGSLPHDYPKEVEKILILILQQIKEGFFKPEFDQEPGDVTLLIADRPKIRNNLASIIFYIRRKLGYVNDEPEDDNNPDVDMEQERPEDDIPDEDIVDIIEEYNGEEGLNDFVVNFKSAKRGAIKKAGDKIIKSTFDNIDLDDDVFTPLKNRSEDDPKSSRPMIDDEDDNELPKVTEVKNKLKNTIKRLIPKNLDNTDNRVEFFTEKIFEKIDTEDPVKNTFWTELVIRTINDKEGEIEDKIKGNLKTLLSAKLLNKIQAKVFNVPGFIEFMRYQINFGEDIGYQQIFPLSKHFTFVNEKQQKVFNLQIKASYYMFVSDIAIFYLFVQKNLRLKSKNTTYLFDDIGKHLLKRSGFNSLEQFNEKMIDTNLILKQYHGLTFFFEFIKVFHLFDSNRFDRSEASIQNIGALFWKMYKFVMLLRVNIRKEIANPIQFAINKIRECAEKTYRREGAMNFNRRETLCQDDYSDYIKMELFLKYYVYNLNPTDKNKQKFFDFNLKALRPNEQFMIVESSTFHKFMDTVQPGQVNMDELCKGYESSDLCLEASMRKQFNLITDNNPIEWNMIDTKIIQPYRNVLNQKKYLFWNLMEIVERLDNFKFEQFLRRLDDKGVETQDNISFVQYLYINDQEINSWVAQYLRLNFSHYSLHLEKLSQVIDHIMTTNQTEKYLTHKETFTYNNEHDVIRQFHFSNVRLFLYLGHKTENYAKLARILKNHTWMVILFKKMVDKDSDQFIKDVSEHIKMGQDNETNATLILQYINKKYEDIKPHSITDQDIFGAADAYDLLEDNMEDDVDDLEGLEDIDMLVDFQEQKPQQSDIVAQVGQYMQKQFLGEFKVNKEDKKTRGNLRNTNQRVYKEVMDVDKGSLMDVLKKVFDHVQQQTGRSEIVEADMQHVNNVLSAHQNLEQSQQLKKVFEDALKDGNVITFENIQLAEIPNNNRLLV